MLQRQAATPTPSHPPAVGRERQPVATPALSRDRWPELHDRVGNQAAARRLRRRAAAVPAAEAAATFLTSAASSAPITAGPQQTSGAPLMLQRKCACGGAGFGGECEECSKKKLGVQTKLRIGAPQDAYEQEADRVAARVTGTSPPPMTSPGAAAERLVATQMEKLEPSELTAGGSPLPSSLRGFFEQRFGRDLGEVRLHAGPQAEARSEQLNAHAFTYGSHIWLGRGHSAGPGFLLAHELAHVIQQRQPRALPATEGRDPSTTASAAPRIQRLGDSVPFWVPLGAKGKKTGTDLHKELLEKAKEKHTDLDIEANAPNADTHGWGLDHRGSIDLYRSTPRHVIPGFYFGTDSLKSFAGVPKDDPPSGFRPYAIGNTIKGITEAPQTVELGELKPASKPMVEAGEKQLNGYLSGMNKAVELTNKWAKIAKAPSWQLPPNKVKKLPKGDASVAEGDPTDLVVADIKESSTRGAKYQTDIRPAWVSGALQVRGRVHVLGLSDGLWVYYAKPENLETTLTNLRSADIRSEIIVANTVQDEVIEPLMRPPEQVAPLRKVRMLPPDRHAFVQRKPKYDQPPGKFKETFPLKTWLEQQGKLRKQIQSPTGDTKTQLAALERFDDAYDANEELAQISTTGVSSLISKKVDLIDVISGSDKTKNKKAHPHDLGKLSGWLKRWTGRPAEILGVFRDVFGGAFIMVAEFFSGAGKLNLLTKIKDTAANLLDKAPFPGGALGDVLKEGLKFALQRISDLLIPSVFRMLTGSIKKGIVKALEGVFEEQLETLAGWKTKIDEFVKKVEGILKPALKVISTVMEVISTTSQIANMVKKAENAIEWGIRLAECSGVWSCLLILLEPFTDRLKDEAIYALKDKILSACGVRSLLGGAVRRLLFDVPFDIANKIMNVAKDLASDAPKPVQTIFSQGIDREEPPELKEMEDNDCWGIDLGFSLFDEGFTHKKKKDEPPSPPAKPSAPPPTTAPAPPPTKTPAPPPPTPPTKTPTTPPTKSPAPSSPPPKLPTPAPTPTQGPPATQRPWDATALAITFHTDKERSVYIESLLEHKRHPKPAEYELGCFSDTFIGDVWFFIDDGDRWRPEPFRPPTVSVSWKAGNRHGGDIDPKPTYEPRAAFSPAARVAHPLKTSFGLDLKIPVSAGDVLELWFTLADPDTQKTLTYQESFKITQQHCV